MTTPLRAGDDNEAVAALAGHDPYGTCAGCGARHSWSDVISAAIAALDRKLKDLQGARAVPTTTYPVYGVVPAQQDQPGQV